MKRDNLINIVTFIGKIPSIEVIDYGYNKEKKYWFKIKIDIDNKLSWNVIQELGHILNYISLDEKLPTLFYPISPPPYLNEGPKDFLSWLIESRDVNFTGDNLLEWLEGRLPNPVDDLTQWN